MTRKLYDLARVLRSKNSGPFAITLDVLFDNPAAYQSLKASNILTPQRVANLYGIRPEQVTGIVYFDPAMGVKITFDRPVSSGSPLDTDVYGAQQHAPLMALEIPMGD